MTESKGRPVAYISAKVPVKLKELMIKFVERDAHLNVSDLIRDAVRTKILDEAPELYREHMREG